MECEVLLTPDMSRRGHRMLTAMCETAHAFGVKVHVSEVWRKKAPVLMTYGLGHMVRRHWTEAHQRNGGQIVGWDLGYWDRESKAICKMRVTVNADHPWRMIAPESPERFAESNIDLRDDYDPRGHIVVVGMGRKQRNWKGLGHQDWERAKIKALREEFPRRQIFYRPKRPERIHGVNNIGGPIEEVLKHASLVVCHHSNVAVDACIAGVPVRCDDGAAYALYRITENPTRSQRLAFLESLAHWQYSQLEAAQAWPFLKAKLGA